MSGREAGFVSDVDVFRTTPSDFYIHWCNDRREAGVIRLEAVRGGAIGPMVMQAMRIARELLPGDPSYGDPLSTAGSEPRRRCLRTAARSSSGSATG